MNDLAMTLIVIFMPGILATVICERIALHSRWTSFKFSTYALLLGMLSYCVMQIGVSIFDIFRWIIGYPLEWRRLNIWVSILDHGRDFNPFEVILSLLIAMPVAFLATWFVNYKISNRIAQKLQISRKYGNDNLYSHHMDAPEVGWVYVRDIGNNLTYQGWVYEFSENEYMQELVLHKVSVFRYEDSEFLYDVPVIYLSRKPGELVIEMIPSDNLEKVDGC